MAPSTACAPASRMQSAPISNFCWPRSGPTWSGYTKWMMDPVKVPSFVALRWKFLRPPRTEIDFKKRSVASTAANFNTSFIFTSFSILSRLFWFTATPHINLDYNSTAQICTAIPSPEFVYMDFCRNIVYRFICEHVFSLTSMSMEIHFLNFYPLFLFWTF